MPRPDVTASELTLINTGAYDEHWRVKVANGSGTMVDISTRLTGGTLKLPNPDAPIGTADLTFLRDVNDDTSGSLAPLMDASDYNRLDDGVTISPLLQIGRAATIEIAVTARRAGRPSDGSSSWHEVLGGFVKQPHSAKRYGDVRVEFHDRAYKLNREHAEEVRTYDSGTAIEATMQAVLDDKFGSGEYTVVVDDVAGSGATGEVLGANYEAKVQPIWDILQDLAHSIGWVCWWRYDASGNPYLALTEPRRSKSSADYTFSTDQVDDVTKLTVIEEDIRNVVVVDYYDTDGGLRTTETAQSVESILKYGGEAYDAAAIAAYDGSQGIRRFASQGEDKLSPIRNAASADKLRDAILSDLADPDLDQAIDTIGAWWIGEPSVDLYAFAANDILYDNAQTLAPYSIEITVAQGELSKATIGARGKPSGGSGQWRSRGRGDPTQETLPRIVRVFTSSQTETHVTKTFWTDQGATEVWLYQRTGDQDTVDLTLNSDDEVVDENGDTVSPIVLTVSDGATSHQFTLPAPDEKTLLLAEPRDGDLEPGEFWEGEIHPIDRPFAVAAEPTQSGSTGTLTLTLTDPRLFVTSVEFQTKEGTGAYGGTWLTSWDLSTGTAGTDSELVRSESVSLASKHVSSIKYRIGYVDEDGVTRYSIGEHTFDADQVAEVAGAAITFDGTGDAVVTVMGDEDTANMYVTVQEGSAPSDPTNTSNNGTVAARFGQVNTGVSIAQGATAYTKVVAYDSNGNPGPVASIQEQRGIGEKLPFGYGWNPSQTGSTGSMTVAIFDPTLAVTAVQFQKREGAGAFGGTWLFGWDSSTGTVGTDHSISRVESLSLAEKHTSELKVRIQYTDSDGSAQEVTFGHTYDADTIAEVTDITPGMDDSGTLYTGLIGDEDTANLYATLTTDGSTPADPTNVSNDGSVSGRSGRITTAKTVTKGDLVKVKAIAYDSNGDAGPIQATEWTVGTEPGADANDPALLFANVSVTDGGAGDDDTYTLVWDYNDQVTTSYTVDALYFRNGVEVDSTQGTTATDGGKTLIDPGAGDGNVDTHWAVVQLLDPSGNAIDAIETPHRDSRVLV